MCLGVQELPYRGGGGRDSLMSVIQFSSTGTLYDNERTEKLGK